MVALSRRALLTSSIAAALVPAMLTLAGCRGGGGGGSNPPPSPPKTVTFDFSFENGLAGWDAEFAEYNMIHEPSMNLDVGHERLPAPLDGVSGVYMAADNRSDDVFMFITRKLDGLAPGQRYRVDLSITIATNVPRDCAGIGGSPGDAVHFKAGAIGVRPQTTNDSGFIRVNIDKGHQIASGTNAIRIGDLAKPDTAPACANQPYERKTMSTTAPNLPPAPFVTADSTGSVWLVLGADSGYEGYTKFYWLEGSARLTPA